MSNPPKVYCAFCDMEIPTTVARLIGTKSNAYVCHPCVSVLYE